MLIQTREQFDAVVDCLKLTERVACDTETNGLEVHKGHRLCGVAVYFPIQTPYTLGAYFPFRHALGNNLFNASENLPIGWLQELGRVIGREDLVTYWHNAKFDFGMLRAEGIEVTGAFFDTMVISTMIDENISHKLGDVEQQFLGTTTKRDLIETNLKPYLKGKKDYSKVPSADMEAYAVNDTRVTFDVVDPLLQVLAAQEQHTLWPDEMRFLRCLFEIEWNGILMDRDMAQSLSEQTQAKMRTLEDEMGFDPQKRAELARRLFASPPEGAGLPAPLRTTKDTSPLFPAGLPVMDEKTLSEYDHPLIAKVLEYRGCVKRNSTWYAGFLRHCDPDGRIHPIYNTAGERDDYGARTGRLTCGHPNIQQLPRDPTSFVRKLCLPPWRFRLVEFDYNQIEYRLAGVYAKEEAILDAYRAGSDMHQLTADKLGIPRVDPKGGLDGKKLNFCVPTHSQILTRSGWKYHDEVISGDETLGYSNGRLKWNSITAVHVFENIEVGCLHNDNFNVVTTPNHRWIGDKPTYTDRLRTGKKETWIQSDSVSVENRIFLSAFAEGGVSDLLPREAALVGWILTDGHIDKRTASVFQDTHSKWYSKLQSLMEYFPHSKYYRPSGIVQWRLRTEYFRGFWNRVNDTDWIQFVLDLTPEARIAFWDAVCQAEGHVDRQGVQLVAQNEGQVADAIELAGYLSGKFITKYKGTPYTNRNGVQHTCLSYRAGKPFVTGQRLHFDLIGEDQVWCPETTLGTWVMKQNGTIMLTGNTILYGGGPQRIADTIGGSLAIGREIYNDFWKNYPNLRALVKSCENAARQRGYIKLWDGSRNHLSEEWTYHKAFNSLIQGGSAKIVQRSMLMIDWNKPYRMVYQVHDALGFYVPDDFREEYIEEIKNIMEWPGPKFGLDFPVEYKDIHGGSGKHFCTEECLHDLALSSY